MAPLKPVKSPYADVMDDTSTSLAGLVTEEIIESYATTTL
ncbi:hypothetical protein JL09_g6528 [Pichia kudriavzevii]|uniref:Uncharacterized protein n=1 Tax=Pichia kudriavzevii TaxID=4909 RepID=A0A099NP92_PICKU|nr:hypothetical protein JL09_g6528 [Pichia kudriavzevii]